jgi:hypothetical protein
LRLNAQVLRVIPPLALLLVFILTFSPWLGLYPGDRAVFTQNAWQAAFGGGTVQEPELLRMPGLFPESDLRSKTTANGPLIFYLLLLIAVVLLAIGSVVVAVLHPPVPEPVEMLLRWRSALVATATSVSFLLLVLQVSMGFSLENVIAQTNQERVDQQMKVARQDKVKAAQDPGYAEMLVQLGLAQFGIGRTTTYRLAVCLHLLAVICLLLECWLSWRGEGRPPPEVAFRW